MLSRIRADESLREVTRIAIGSGLGKPAERTRVLSAWEHAAEGVPMPAVRKVTPESLRAAGIGVRQVSAPAKG